MTKQRLAGYAVLLSGLFAFIECYCIADNGTGNMNPILCDALLIGSYALPITAAILGSKRWLWLLLAYSILFIIVALANLRFGF